MEEMSKNLQVNIRVMLRSPPSFLKQLHRMIFGFGMPGSHNHINVHTKDLIRQLRENNVNLGKVYNIIGSFFGSVEKVPFTKRTLGKYMWED